MGEAAEQLTDVLRHANRVLFFPYPRDLFVNVTEFEGYTVKHMPVRGRSHDAWAAAFSRDLHIGGMALGVTVVIRAFPGVDAMFMNIHRSNVNDSLLTCLEYRRYAAREHVIEAIVHGLAFARGIGDDVRRAVEECWGKEYDSCTMFVDESDGSTRYKFQTKNES